MAFDSSVQLLTATILNGQTVSNEVDVGQNRAVRLSMPAAFTGTALGVQTLAADGATYQPLYNPDGTAYTITVAAAREVLLQLSDILSVQKFKLVSNAAEGADRAIGVFVV